MNKSDFEFVLELLDYEDVALKMLKPVDLTTVNPTVIISKWQDRAQSTAWNYWRYALSSEPQRPVFNHGRTTRYFLIDKTGGGLLGVFAITDCPQDNPFLDSRFGWQTPDIPGTHGGEIQNYAKLNGLHTMTTLRRCLPIYEFGQMTGGKCMTALALTRDVLRPIEEKYSFKISILLATSLHGKSSQYNRLQDIGLDFAGIREDTGAAYYICELRKKAEAFLKGDAPLGKFRVRSYGENLDYWKNRWLAPRMVSKKIDHILPDPNKYRLSDKIRNPL